MASYSVRREWASGFRITDDELREINASIYKILLPQVQSSVSLELSNLSSIRVRSLADALAEDNAPGRLFEVLTLEYSSSTPGPPAISERVQLTLSRRPTHPAISVQLEAGSQERLALLTREVVSRVESIAVAKSLAERLMTAPRPGDVSPVAHLAMLLPIGVAVWTSWTRVGGLQAAVDEIAPKIQAAVSASDVGRFLVELMVRTEISRTMQMRVIFLSLAFAVVVWLLHSQQDFTASVSRHFLINDYGKRFRTSLAFRAQLLWSGVVVLLVSALGSALIYWFTR
jgi:hypothetical protein